MGGNGTRCCLKWKHFASTASRKRIVDANYPLHIAALHRLHVDETWLALMRFKEKLRHSRRPVYGVVLLVVKYVVTKHPAKRPVLTSCTVCHLISGCVTVTVPSY